MGSMDVYKVLGVCIDTRFWQQLLLTTLNFVSMPSKMDNDGDRSS